MKKVLLLLLCLTLSLSLFGCGSKPAEEPAEEPAAEPAAEPAVEPAEDEASARKGVIDLGGGLGEITYEGDAYGTYTLIETPESFIFDDDTEVTVYEDQSCNTPYIAVYRFAKGDDTLETIAQSEANLYSNGYYQLFEGDEENNIPQCAYLCTCAESDGNYYYIDSSIHEDGDDFVVVDCYAKTEELPLGDSGSYVFVPAGYTDIMSQDDADHGTVFYGEYDSSYYFPTMWVGKWDDSYDYLKWLWAGTYPDELPITEEEYADELAELRAGKSISDYYEKMGCEVLFDSNDAEKCSYDYEGEFTVTSEGTGIWLNVGEEEYNAWFTTELNPAPSFAAVFLASLHTK